MIVETVSHALRQTRYSNNSDNIKATLVVEGRLRD